MNLASHLLQLLETSALGKIEEAELRCRLARELEEGGDYEAARRAMGPLWRRVGERPLLDGLDKRTAAEVLLRAGTLSGWIGSASQVEGAQEMAKDLISESAALFESLGETTRTAEACIDLAICYWREGAFDEARVTLGQALGRLTDQDVELRARVFLNSTVVEVSARRLHDALRIITEAAPVFAESRSHALKGKFHLELALILRLLGAAEGRADYIDRALVEYTAASFHFEQAGDTRFRAAVENNLGSLFTTLGKYQEAEEHLDHARRLFVALKDQTRMAQVDDTRARAFLSQGLNAAAEDAASAAVRSLERGEEPSLLAEALITQGAALARMGRTEQARSAFERAIETAYRAGDAESAGVAALSIIEELSDQLTSLERKEIYERADDLLSGVQQPAILLRLRECARKVLAERMNELAHDRAVTGEEEEADASAREAADASLAAPWESFSLDEEVRRIEHRLIEQALKEAGGSVSLAARLLGFKHHQSLNSLIESKHPDLSAKRVPARPRKRRSSTRSR
ncbi:MAG TPA: helix-turn-helix domain-containing protein [Pyrinomonadaceae bacterium]|jgi:tetratricopeptide (TPR) repeat protein